MASFKFKKAYLGDSSSISSKNENIKTKFSLEDYFEGYSTSEEAEVKMEKKVLDDLLENHKIDLVVGGDLSNQLGITNETLSNYDLSYLGLYSACSSYVEGLILSASLLDSEKLKNIITLVSSHNLDAERTFRYPIEYGSPRRTTQTFTATAAIASIVSKEETKIKIES